MKFPKALLQQALTKVLSKAEGVGNYTKGVARGVGTGISDMGTSVFGIESPRSIKDTFVAPFKDLKAKAKDKGVMAAMIENPNDVGRGIANAAPVVGGSAIVANNAMSKESAYAYGMQAECQRRGVDLRKLAQATPTSKLSPAAQELLDSKIKPQVQEGVGGGHYLADPWNPWSETGRQISSPFQHAWDWISAQGRPNVIKEQERLRLAQQANETHGGHYQTTNDILSAEGEPLLNYSEYAKAYGRPNPYLARAQAGAPEFSNINMPGAAVRPTYGQFPGLAGMNARIRPFEPVPNIISAPSTASTNMMPTSIMNAPLTAPITPIETGGSTGLQDWQNGVIQQQQIYHPLQAAGSR